MKIADRDWRSIWALPGGTAVEIIDQTLLPHRLATVRLSNVADVARAIRTMQVRGAPLIGVTAAYGIALALAADASDAGLDGAARLLIAQRPTASNLAWAVDAVRRHVLPMAPAQRARAAFDKAGRLAEADIETCRSIGQHGLGLIRAAAAHKASGSPVNILTHCNAGWLACVDWGTATAPIYAAAEAGIDVHVWVDETRPRNQGAALTAFELGGHGIAHTVIADNAGGHLMQHGQVDLVIVGTDRVAANGDVANKIGTYLKALAANDTGVPFYVALPHSTIDWALQCGPEIPIEERSASEVLTITGRDEAGRVVNVEIAAPGSPAANPAFDVTPARLVTGLITERGICAASNAGLAALYPEAAHGHAV